MRFPTIYSRYNNQQKVVPWTQTYRNTVHYLIADYFIDKWQTRMRESGALHTAKQMRKQGIPLIVALSILFRVSLFNE